MVVAQAPRMAGRGYLALLETQRGKVAGDFARRRPLISLAISLPTIALLVAAHHPWPRIAVVACAYAAMFVFALVASIQVGKRGGIAHPGLMYWSSMVTFTTVAINIAATGGLAGPLSPGIVPVAIGIFVTYGRSRESTVTATYVVLATIGLALLPRSLTGPVPAYPWNAAMTLISLLFGVTLFYNIMMSLSDAMATAEAKMDQLREDVLDQAGERNATFEGVGAKVAHELKNPLSSVKGLVQLLARKADDDKSRERFGVVIDEVSRMERILADYLSFSRPLAALRPEPVQLGRVVDSVLAVVEARAASASTTISRTGDATVNADPRRLKEALLNLISNALDASPSSIEVGITMDDQAATLTVSDTGRGMSADTLARIGTPFFTMRDGGTGLGVCLAKSVVAQHGGKLAFTSEPGKGTRATLTLPLANPARAA
ncbi:MAG: two-component system sensor histidine kinase NtrB [Polyangiales bacterium]